MSWEYDPPQPIIASNDWLVVENPADWKVWRSSFLPRGWNLVQEPPIDLLYCALPRLDHALSRMRRTSIQLNREILDKQTASRARTKQRQVQRGTYGPKWSALRQWYAFELRQRHGATLQQIADTLQLSCTRTRQIVMREARKRAERREANSGP